jgi:signal peptidase I
VATTADPGDDPEAAASERQQQAGPLPRRRRLRVLAGWVLPLVAALLLALGLRAFAFQAFSIPSASMEPTLGIGDRILVWKAFFTWHDVRQGDIVVFTHPPHDHCPGPPHADLVKRVIALPGQTIYSAGNSIYVDGRRLPESYLPPRDPLGSPIPAASWAHPFHVPPGEFYVMGDNRQFSCDSRSWGPIQANSIIGKVVLLFWHQGHPDLHFFWSALRASNLAP